jgi:NADH:ubiquinone oxidoreductase subunit 4 (subunit M)
MGRSPPITAGSVRVAVVAALLALSLPLAQDAAEEGKKIITAMLIVGLVFVAVIALGQLSYWLRHRR